MLAMVLNIALGAAAGAVCALLCYPLAVYLLNRREKALALSTKEVWLFRIACAVFGAAIAYAATSVPVAAFLFCVLFVAGTAALTDVRFRLIPNELILMLFVVRLAFGIPAELGVAGFPAFDLVQAALGCAACLVLFLIPAVFGKSVGLGDVKFVAAMGFCLGFYYSMVALALMGVLVLLYFIGQKRLPMLERFKSMVPMAPFLSAAMMMSLIAQVAPLGVV